MREICTCCKQECRGEHVDFGLGLTEFWGSVSSHHDVQYVSRCCRADVERIEGDDAMEAQDERPHAEV